VSQGRNDEALNILRKAARTNGLDPDEVFPSGFVIKPEPEENSSYLQLFTPKWRKITLLLWGVWFGFSFAYYGTILAVTRVFQDNSDNSDGTPNFNFEAIFISCTAEILGTTIIIFSVDSIGRIRSQQLSYTLGGLCVFMLCLPSLKGSVGTLTVLAFVARVFEMAASCLTWVTTVEILTTEIRTTGHSAANAVARIGGFICPYVVEGNTKLFTVGIVMIVIHALAVFCVTFLPETKGKAMGFHDTSGISNTTNTQIQNESTSPTVINSETPIS